MPESTVVRVKRDGQILVTDGSKSYTVAYEPGDFKFTVPLESVNVYLDRGVMSDGTRPSLRKVDDQPVTFSFSAYLRDIGSSTYTTLADLAIRFASYYVTSNWTSTLSGYGDVETVTVQLTIDGGIAGEADKTLSFPFSVIRADAAEGDPDTVSITGTAYVLRPTLA